jgi:hypothetical protein
MGEADADNVQRVSSLKRGDKVCFMPGIYTEVVEVRAEPGKVWLVTRNPMTGLLDQTEYEPDDLVVAKPR